MTAPDWWNKWMPGIPYSGPKHPPYRAIEIEPTRTPLEAPQEGTAMRYLLIVALLMPQVALAEKIGPTENVPPKVISAITERCTQLFSDDYSMQVSCINQELEAYAEMAKFKARRS